MRILIQRVSNASVAVEGEIVGKIGRGLLVFFCAEQGDREEQLDYLVDKTVNLRIFPDETGKMNRSLIDTGGGILCISQFTLAADTRRGRRPGFSAAAPPQEGKMFYEKYVLKLKEAGVKVETGVFGAEMKVTLTNEGPVTIPVSAPIPPG